MAGVWLVQMKPLIESVHAVTLTLVAKSLDLRRTYNPGNDDGISLLADAITLGARNGSPVTALNGCAAALRHRNRRSHFTVS